MLFLVFCQHKRLTVSDDRAWRISGRVGSNEIRHRVASGAYVIGSSDSADLTFGEPTVSRRHARLTVSTEGVAIEDLESSNGTFVNGRRLRGSQQLEPDDDVRLGDLELAVTDANHGDLTLAIPGESGREVAPSMATWGENQVGRFCRRGLPELLDRLAEEVSVETFAALLTESLAIATDAVSFELRRGGALLAGPSQHSLAHRRTFRRHGYELVAAAESAENIEKSAPMIDIALRLLPLVASPRSDRPVMNSGKGAKPPDPPTANAELRSLYEQARKVAASRLNVLIQGETGTGKELFANFVHQASGVKGPLITINCAALSKDLLEAELFGIEKGVATGVNERKGCFELAHQGTLFLDELGDMDSSTQARILRALQEKVVYRVGGQKPRTADVRIMGATNRALETMVEEGSFRRDLFYRLADWSITLPSLRARKEDISRLAVYFLSRELKQQNKRLGGLSAAAVDALEQYPWPGNVRELEREMMRCALFLEDGEALASDQLQGRIRSGAGNNNVGGSLDEIVKNAERNAIRNALDAHNGDIQRAADALSMARSTLYRRISQLGIGD